MTGKKLIHGYLDRLRENLETLDEQIANARKMSKKKGKDSNALQWAKTLRDLVELRETTLVNIKVHLLGRDESGAATEPPEYYRDNANPEVMFERDFQAFLAPWTREDLKLKCEDCGAESEGVISRSFEKQVSLGVGDMMTTETEYRDLCSRCYEKRTAKEVDGPGESEDGDPDSSGGDPLEKIDLSTLAPEAVAVVRALQEARKQLLGTKEAGRPKGP